MKKIGQLSPVLVELAVVTLFLALSTSVVIQLIAKAGEISRTAGAESRVLIAVEDAMEQIKARPDAEGFDGKNRRTVFMEDDGVQITGAVERAESSAGFLYRIELTAAAEGCEPILLRSARYVPKEMNP